MPKYSSSRARMGGARRTASAARADWPRGVMMWPGTLWLGTGTYSRGPTAMATRYEDIGGVRPKCSVFRPSARDVRATGALATASSVSGTVRVSCQLILKAGSSQQGKALRAWLSSNWVKRYGSPRLTVL